MGYRHLIIASPGKLSVRRGQLMISGTQDSSYPMEDIDSLLIENQQTVISAAALDALADAGVAVFICNGKHMPSAVVLPYQHYSRKLSVLELQINTSRPRYKNIWQQIIKRKILNQAEVLRICKKEVESNNMLKLVSDVKSGDRTNVEGQAAAYYFMSMFTDEFHRHHDDFLNAVLDYGYAILRGEIARTLALYGFEPSLGIFHHSHLNRFNLADDLIEVYRPVVDLYASKLVEASDEMDLTPGIKRDLVGLLNADVFQEKQCQPLSYAIERTVQSYMAVLSGKEKEVRLCSILPLKLHGYE